MEDRIRTGFLQRQLEEAMALSGASDKVTLTPFPGSPPERYLIELRCRGLVRAANGTIEISDRFGAAVYFGEDYLRSVPSTFEVLTWLGPANVFHPNIAPSTPFICLGRLTPGTGLVEITYRLWELITFRKATLNEHDSLNREACQWARQNQHRFPVDQRGLKRRAVDFKVRATEVQR